MLLKVISIAVFLFSTILAASLVHAAEQFDMVDSSFRMLWGLLIVLAIIFVIYAILRKRVTGFQHGDRGFIKIVEVKHIMPKKSLMLVEIRGQEFVVGAGNDTINTIVPLHQSSSFSALLEKSEEKISL